MNKAFALIIPFASLLCLAPPVRGAAPAKDDPYRLLKEIAIGGEGGWDYLFVDSTARRLYVSHATKVVVIDLDPATHKIYLSSAELALSSGAGRPSAVPGTFKVLVYGTVPASTQHP